MWREEKKKKRGNEMHNKGRKIRKKRTGKSRGKENHRWVTIRSGRKRKERNKRKSLGTNTNNNKI